MSDNCSVNLFYSYSHKDARFRDQLETCLTSLMRQNVIDAWSDCDIAPGSEWQQKIEEKLNNADIILLLVSPDFFASDFCSSIEVTRAMEKHKEGSAVVIPISLRPCDTTNAVFMICNGLPEGFKPITTWRNRDSAFTDIAKGIRAAAEKIQQQKKIRGNAQLKGQPSKPSNREENTIDFPTGIPTSVHCLKFLDHDDYGFFLDVEVKGIKQRFRWIKPSTFLMGSPSSEPERSNYEVRHKVMLTSGFWLADAVVTQSLWQALMDENPSEFKKDPNNPVENISWLMIQEFIRKFNQHKNINWENIQNFCASLNQPIPCLKARLPSEAEWEYACRAGTATPFYFGDKLTPSLINYDGHNPYAGAKTGLNRKKTVAVKSLPANHWGLYEMHGNVFEWCQDFWADLLPVKSNEDTLILDKNFIIDPIGPDVGTERVIRGGSWDSVGRDVRSACRKGEKADYRDGTIGFRLVLSLEFRPE